MVPPPFAPESVLVATGLGSDGRGGIYEISSEAQAVDHLLTTGLAVSPDGTQLARALYDPLDDPQAAGEIARYDRRGGLTHQRIDELREAHTLLWEDDGLIVVSTLDNAVLRLDPAGQVMKRWQLPGTGDAWHINNVIRHEGRLLASCFGRFEHHRDWAVAGARTQTGVVFDLDTGEDVLTGLTAPHDPTPLDGGWLICNSGTQELLRVGADGAIAQRRALGGWTRGLAYDDDHVYVGVSTRRHAGESQAASASVLTLDRHTFDELARVDVPCAELYALAFVPKALIEGVRVGWSVSPARRHAAIDSVEPQPPAPELVDRRLQISIEPPDRVKPGEALAVQYAASNNGRAVIYNFGPEAAVVASTWVTLDGAAAGNDARARLVAPILPGETIAGTLRFTAPPAPGNYRLRVSALQEGVVWFDSLDATLGGLYDITVQATITEQEGSVAAAPLRQRIELPADRTTASTEDVARERSADTVVQPTAEDAAAPREGRGLIRRRPGIGARLRAPR